MSIKCLLTLFAKIKFSKMFESTVFQTVQGRAFLVLLSVFSLSSSLGTLLYKGIDVAPITQVTHVRNKIVTFKGGHLL